MATPSFRKTDEEIQAALKSLINRAIELGADRALTITTDRIIVDERVRAKCRYPPCNNYGSSLMCPPYSMVADEFRRLANLYKHAILVRVDVKPEDMAGLEARKRGAYLPYSARIHEIINQLESEAFYQGFYLAMGLKSGPCRLCTQGPQRVECEALKTGSCRFPLKARPAMESVGIDVYATVSSVGWEIYPIGIRSNPSEVPCGGFHGVLLVV